MHCDAVVHSWVYEWQTLIAGVLALVAGVATVIVTRHATKRTVAATLLAAQREIDATLLAAQQQIEAANRQLAYAQDAERRKLARDAYAACELLSSVLAMIDRKAKEVLVRFEQNLSVQYEEMDGIGAFFDLQKPDLSTVWNTLSLVGRESKTTYIALDQQIEHRRRSWPGMVNGTVIANEISMVSLLAAQILAELDQESRRCLEVLAVDKIAR